MKRYVELNNRYYALLLRHRAQRKIAMQYYNSNETPPTDFVRTYNRTLDKLRKTKEELERIENNFDKYINIELVLAMILTGKKVHL